MSDAFMPNAAGRGATVVHLLRERAMQEPERQAVTWFADIDEPASTLTYDALDRRARAIAAMLQTRAAPRSRALLVHPPGLDSIAAFFGCLYAGVVAVIAQPPRARVADGAETRLRAIIGDAAPALLLTTRAGVEASESFLTREARGRLTCLATDAIAPDVESAWREPAIGPDDLAFLQYSSGSTAAPKGVMVSHANVLHNERMIQVACRHDAESTFVGWLPLFHDMGLIGNLLQPLFIGAHTVLMSPAAFLQKPLRWLTAISRYRAHTSGGPNFAYDYCVRRIAPANREGLDLRGWKVAFNGAEPVRPDVMERFAEAFAPCGFDRSAFFPCYGLAEATLIVSGSRRDRAPVVRRLDARALEQHRVVDAADGDPGARPVVSCGEPVADTSVAIVDPETRVRREAGAIGEIWISGPAVTRGYWGQLERTRETFHAGLASEPSGAPRTWMRTGDLGFRDDDGLFVIGRLDDLIIVRGQNHHPEDIEWTVQQAGLTHLAVVFDAGDASEPRVTVVLERDGKGPVDIDSIAWRVRELVAERHELQVHAVVVTAPGGVPRTSSGKTQRRLCRRHYLSGELQMLASSVLDAVETPSNDLGLTRDALLAMTPDARPAALERACARSIAVLVRNRELPVDRRLASVGMDSLAAIEIRSRLDAAFGVALPLASLLGGFSVRDAAAYVLHAVQANEAMQAMPGDDPAGPATLAASVTRIEARAPRDEWPLSPGQRALWFIDQVDEARAAYNIAVAARVRRALDIEALSHAAADVVARHGTLRATFAGDGEGPRQKIAAEATVDFAVVQAKGWTDDEIQRRARVEADRPFDLTRDPLLRVAVFARGDESVLMLASHHIAADLWSFGTLLAELGAAYAHRLGEGPALPSPAIDYGDYVLWLRDHLAGGHGERLRSYWRRQLAGRLPALELPADRVRQARRRGRGDAVTLSLEDVALRRIEAFAQAHGVTVAAVLLTAYEVVIARHSGQWELLIGAPGAGRARPEFAHVVGYVANLLPIRTRLGPNMRVAECLAHVQAASLAAYEHQEYPFPWIVEELQPDRDPSRAPLLQNVFAFQKTLASQEGGLVALALGASGAQVRAGALVLESVLLPASTSQFDLVLTMGMVGERMIGTLRYDTDLFERARIERIAGHLRRVLIEMMEAPERPLADLTLPAPEEAARLAAAGARLPVETEELGLHELFARQARQRPDAVAIVHGDQHVSYVMLAARAANLGGALQAGGVRPEDRVALVLDRDPQLVEAMLGVLQAGAAYVACDTSTPPQRIASLIEDSGARVVLAAPGMRDRLRESQTAGAGITAGGTGAAVHVLAAETAEAGAGVSLGAPSRASSITSSRAATARAAYVIYTSGSTGVPKGVVVSHENVARLLKATEPWFAFGDADVWTLFHSSAFDFSVWEIWGALLTGGRLVIVPSEVSRSPEDFLALIVREQVTVLNQTPTAFAQLAQADARGDAHRYALRDVIFGGEALDPSRLRSWVERYGCARPRLVNMYGITETTVHVTYAVLTEAEILGGASRRIGRAIPDLSTWVCDAAMTLAPIGVPGELFVGGAGVARGYLDRPRLTAERFVPDPFSGESGARLYRTGDVVRRRDDLELEYLGRIDRQVKVRGHRIEPGEIEGVLRQHPDVRDAVVIMPPEDRGGGAGGAGAALAAYVILAPARQDLPPDLWSFITNRLPAYMIPAAIVAVPAFPLTPNGKLDTDALPPPDGSPRADAGTYAAPRTALERVLADCWAETLEVDRVGIDDNFFALGGHSLLATRLAWTLHEIFPIETPIVRAILAHPTVTALAAAMAALASPGTDLQRIAELYLQIADLPPDEVDRLLSLDTVSLK